MQRREWLKAGGATLAAPIAGTLLRPFAALAQTPTQGGMVTNLR